MELLEYTQPLTILDKKRLELCHQHYERARRSPTPSGLSLITEIVEYDEFVKRFFGLTYNQDKLRYE